jgi:hypothetical protein
VRGWFLTLGVFLSCVFVQLSVTGVRVSELSVSSTLQIAKACAGAAKVSAQTHTIALCTASEILRADWSHVAVVWSGPVYCCSPVRCVQGACVLGMRAWLVLACISYQLVCLKAGCKAV